MKISSASVNCGTSQKLSGIGNINSLVLCMGSACYQHGAPEILKIIQNKLEEYHLKTEVELMGHFCLGKCGKAILMKYGDQYFKNMTPENAADIFEVSILPLLVAD